MEDVRWVGTILCIRNGASVQSRSTLHELSRLRHQLREEVCGSGSGTPLDAGAAGAGPSNSSLWWPGSGCKNGSGTASGCCGCGSGTAGRCLHLIYPIPPTLLQVERADDLVELLLAAAHEVLARPFVFGVLSYLIDEVVKSTGGEGPS